MTYTICRTVGFNPVHAFIVAMSDVSTDDLDSTVAAGSIDGKGPSTNQAHVDSSWMWHAIAPSDEAWNALQTTGDILQQKNLLFQLALDKWLDPELDREGLGRSMSPLQLGNQRTQQLKWLGVFFHYQQDTWAHRKVPNRDSRTKWEAYQTPFGHVAPLGSPAVIHEPDRPPYNPIGALRNLEDGIIYAATFLKRVIGREPNPHFVDFEIGPWENRNEPRGTGYFNQLTRVAKTDAGKYLEDLIRAQIDVYTSSAIGRPDEVDTVKVMDALRKVWNDYRAKLQLGAGVDGTYPPSSEFAATRAARDQMQITKMIEGTNELVAKMGAWQDVLGFPTVARPYHLLWPSRPDPDRKLQRMTGPWRWVEVSKSIADDFGAASGPKPEGGVYNNAPVRCVTPIPGGTSCLGLSKNGMLLYRRSSDAPWKRAPNSNAFSADGSEHDAVVLDNIEMRGSTLIGTPRNPYGKPEPMTPDMEALFIKGEGPVWSYSDPDKLP